MLRALAFGAAAAILVGCESQRLALGNEAEVRASTDQQLITAYMDTGSAKLKAELERRGTFTEHEWMLISRRGIQMGMREEVVWVSWGRPWRENEEVDETGRYRQLCYATNASDLSKTYIYLRNGRVTGWQELIGADSPPVKWRSGVPAGNSRTGLEAFR